MNKLWTRRPFVLNLKALDDALHLVVVAVEQEDGGQPQPAERVNGGARRCAAADNHCGRHSRLEARRAATIRESGVCGVLHFQCLEEGVPDP